MFNEPTYSVFFFLSFFFSSFFVAVFFFQLTCLGQKSFLNQQPCYRINLPCSLQHNRNRWAAHPDRRNLSLRAYSWVHCWPLYYWSASGGRLFSLRWSRGWSCPRTNVYEARRYQCGETRFLAEIYVGEKNKKKMLKIRYKWSSKYIISPTIYKTLCTD